MEQDYFKVDNIISSESTETEENESSLREKLKKAGRIALSAVKAAGQVLTSIPVALTPGSIAGFVLGTAGAIAYFGRDVKDVLEREKGNNAEPVMG